MFRNSIRQKIVGIAAGLIVLAVITSLLSMVMAGQVGHLLDELNNRYIPAYGDLARANVRSLERALARVLRKTATRVTEGEATPIAIGPEDLRVALGRQRFHNEAAERTATPGVATGLAVTGTGGADKDQVRAMVARLCGLAPSTDHVADALAAAICDLHRAPLRAAIREAG